MTLLHLQGLVAGYGPVRALDDVSLEVDAGETVAIVGANGAGKTSLLMAISGLVPLRSGQIRYQGRPLAGVSPHEIARAGIGHVPEGRRIFPYLTVRENLELGAVARRERAGLRGDIAAACDLFPVLASRMRQLGGTLSGGEQQMLAIARALVGRPRLVLLDEPSLGLAPLMMEKVFAAIASLGARGIAVVLVEQNARASLRLATRAHVLEHGRIVLSGAGDALAADPRVRAAYLGER
ncbi:MAG TPA: ABC transporter ATP-binding protein [Planctomycetaceae bacterium]|jgi:branched-chain amino acid transport system ATP-binding protein|nr:ABC transporter ATP-binding protein [Planctomycetaceae bacterium]